jgi:phosphatidate cytidylyltransferase
MKEAIRTLLRRFSSTIALWFVVLITIVSGWEPAFVLLISSLATLGLWEYYRMLRVRGHPCFPVFGLVCGIILQMGSFYWFRKVGPESSYDFEIATLVFFFLVVFARQMFERTRDPEPLETMAFTVFGLFYVPWLFCFLTKIVYLFPRAEDGSTTGHWYVLFLILVTKFSDMGAYITGSMIGRTPLVPHISPKKTWEGFFGSLIFSLLGGWGLVQLLPEHLRALTITHALILSPLLGLAAVVGDLGESLLKRSCGVKDSGGILPGIGGVLDLIDSILFSAPLMFFYVRTFVEFR